MTDIESDTPLKGDGVFSRAARLELELTEAVGLFLVWSMLVTIEGTIRLVSNASPEFGLTPDEGFPPAALLAGGIAEVIMGALGLLMAVSVLLFKKRSATMLVGFLIIQSVLGWYVFVTYVLAVPLYDADNLAAGRFGLSLGADRFLIIMGLLTSVSWCAALQSGQFVLAARVRTMILGKADSLKMHKLRAIVWCALAAMAGVAMAITGAVVLASADGSSPHIPPPAYPPHVNIYPEMTLCTGLVTIVWAALGLLGSMSSNKGLLGLFHHTWFVTFMVNLITFALVFGKVPMGALAAPSAQHCVLVFAFTVLPIVFTSKIVEWDERGRFAGEEM